MHRIAIPSVFPLPLAPFEWFMLEDDQPGYPMAFVFWLRLSGRIRRRAFESALEQALARHPLLCAVVKRPTRRHPVWQLNGKIPPYLDWNVEGTPLAYAAGERIDLASEAGLRVWVRQGDDGARITLQFHHACCDGLGALQFIGDLLAGYGIRTAAGNDTPKLQPLEAKRLLTRGFGKSLASSDKRSQKKGAALREVFDMCSCQASPLNLPECAAPQYENRLLAGIVTRTLDIAQSHSLLATARRQGVTLNDLLLCWIFLTIGDWNARHGSSPPREWLCVAMPASLREPDDERMPAANRVTINFLTRAIDECRDAKSLLKSIHEETARIKQTRDGSNFLKVLKLVQEGWGGLPKYFTHERCLATAVLSNIGEVAARLTARFPRDDDGRIVAGNLVLEQFSGVPPLRAQTHAVMLASTYGGTITFSVRCDPQFFTSAHAEEFLSLYMTHL